MVIVTAALTGNMTVPSQTPYLPFTPDELAEQAAEAWEAGAAVIHVHARDPINGRPVTDLNIFGEILRKIKARCNAVICTSTGGGPGMTVDERMAVVKKYKPEMASFNMGSMNFALFQVAERIKEFKYEWEKPYLEATKDFVFKNTFQDLERLCQIVRENETKPEIEIYDVGQLYNLSYLVSKGLLDFPLHIQFVMGVLGGIGTSLEDLMHLYSTARRLFGDRFTWSVIGVGYPAEFVLGTHAVLMGGNVRVGLEDNIKVSRTELARGNADLVRKMVRIIKELDLEVATSDQAREILGLKGINKVEF